MIAKREDWLELQVKASTNTPNKEREREREEVSYCFPSFLYILNIFN